MTINPDYAIFNPHNKPIEELPVIYGFNNGGSPGFMHAQLLSEDGAGLGGHLCSHEGFMLGDLGILTGYRKDRHEGFQKYYPDGYRMDFITDLKDEKFRKALELNQATKGAGHNSIVEETE